MQYVYYMLSASVYAVGWLVYAMCCVPIRMNCANARNCDDDVLARSLFVLDYPSGDSD